MKVVSCHWKPKLIALIAVCVTVVLWHVTAYPRGAAVALIHQATKHYVVKTYGLASPWRLDYAALLKSRYGIQLEVVAGCVVNEQLTRYVDGYNRIATAQANKRFSHDIFEECSREAKAHYLTRAKKTE